MSLFFNYFKGTLKWLFIQSPGPIAALVHGGALVLDDARDAILWLRYQSSPETCDDEFLEIHGRARGIYQRYGESIEKFRVRVVRAYAWQLLGGRNVGLSKLLDHYGYGGAGIFNMRNEDPERWAEFRVELPLSGKNGLAEPDVKNIIQVVNDQKPARSKAASLRLAREQRDHLTSGIVLRESTRIMLMPYSSYGVDSVNRVIGCAVRVCVKKKVKVHTFIPVIDTNATPFIGTAFRMVKKHKIGAKYV